VADSTTGSASFAIAALSVRSESWQAPSPRGAPLHPSLRHARNASRSRARKVRSRQTRNRLWIKESQGWGLSFGLPFLVSSFRSPDERSDIRGRLRGFTAAPRVSLRSPGLRRNRRKRNAGKRRVTTAASCDAARALLERARLTAFHHGSRLGEYLIPKVSFRPGFLGRGLHGRYPPSPVPVQGSTSHPGRNAGRHDAQAAREQAANPPAGTALAPMTRCASAPRPSRSEDYGVTGIGTNVKSVSPKKIRRDLPLITMSALPPGVDGAGNEPAAQTAIASFADTAEPVFTPQTRQDGRGWY
jgi:hypothetical protein